MCFHRIIENQQLDALAFVDFAYEIREEGLGLIEMRKRDGIVRPGEPDGRVRLPLGGHVEA
jgi:hypothetical protein